jgi:alpha-ribazole phosphatase
MRLSVLRHGATPLSGRFCGRLDPELTVKGWEEMRHRCSGRKWDIIISSPARRCAAFAAELAPGHIIDDGFAELDFGVWDGRSSEELWEENPEALKRFWEDPDASPPPGGERWSAMMRRVEEAVTRFVITASARRAENLLLVTHAGVMRVLLERYVSVPLAATWNISLPTGAMLEFDLFEDDELAGQRAVLRSLQG